MQEPQRSVVAASLAVDAREKELVREEVLSQGQVLHAYCIRVGLAKIVHKYVYTVFVAGELLYIRPYTVCI